MQNLDLEEEIVELFLKNFEDRLNQIDLIELVDIMIDIENKKDEVI